MRLRRLWRIDLVRHSAVAFTGAAVLCAAVLGLALIMDIGASTGVQADREPPSGREARYRYPAETEGKTHGQLAAVPAAERDLPRLIAAGTREDGYQFGYGYAWNQAVSEASVLAPLQSRAQDGGMQWIELLR